MALRRRGPRGQRRHELFPGFSDVYEIGVGSLAVVFRARELGTNRHVALKLLNVRDASPRSIESFERESIALGALSSHPNIVTLYRTFRTPDGRPVLVLELCSGAVSDRLRNGAGLPVTDVVSIGVKIAGALETAHRGGILHRDVKPQNILVTEFGEPALADFGVAMLQSSTQTTAGLFDFTTLHAAPELLEGTGTSAATDVYELASSLYQLIAGQSAFRAYEGESPASVILRILRDPVRPLSGVDVPMALSDLLIRAMSKEKDERPPTAAEFAAELAEVEIAQSWNRTQFLIRDPGPLGTGLAPAITRMPDAVPRGLPSTLAPSGPISQLTQVGSPQSFQPAGVHAVPAQAAAPSAPSVPPVRGPEPAAAAWSAPTIVPAGGWTPPPAEPIRQLPQPPTPTVPAPQQPAAGEQQPSTGIDGWWSSPAAAAVSALPPVMQPPAPGAADGWWSAPPANRGDALDASAGAAAPALPALPGDLPARAADGVPPKQLPPADWAGFTPPPIVVSPPVVVSPAETSPGVSGPPSTRSRRRVPVEIDDEFLPAAGPGGGFYTGRHEPSEGPRHQPEEPQRPTSQPDETAPAAAVENDTGAPVQSQTVPTDVPAEAAAEVAAEIASPASAPPAAEPAAVPVWAVRAPAPSQAAAPSGPQFISDLSLDPMSLRRRATLRAGASAVTVDEQHLRLRTWFKSTEVPWSDVHGFEANLDSVDESPATSGHIVALTNGGPVELPGTRRPLGELSYVHALLDAYRIRAQHIANR